MEYGWTALRCETSKNDPCYLANAFIKVLKNGSRETYWYYWYYWYYYFVSIEC